MREALSLRSAATIALGWTRYTESQYDVKHQD